MQSDIFWIEICFVSIPFVKDRDNLGHWLWPFMFLLNIVHVTLVCNDQILETSTIIYEFVVGGICNMFERLNKLSKTSVNM